MKLVYFGLLILFFFVFSCSSADESNYYANEEDYLSQIKGLADKYLEEMAYFFPEQRAFTQSAQVDYSRFTDNSAAGYKKWLLFEDSIYAEFRKLPTQYEIGKEPWYIYGILKEVLESNIGLRICRPELMPVSHIHGWQVFMVDLIAMQPFGTKSARSDAIKRWSSFNKYIDNEISNLRTGVKLGYTCPKEIVQIVVKQLDEILNEPIENSGFYSPALRDVDEAFENEWKALVAGQIYPAIRKYHDFLLNEYYPSAREDLSIFALPNGEKCFEAYFRFHTSLKMSMKEIIEAAEYRVKVNDSKLKIIGKDAYGTDNISKVISRIHTDSAECFKTKEELLKFIKSTIAKAEKSCLLYFEKLPASKIEVRTIPEKDIAHPSSYYIGSSVNSDNSPMFYTNISSPQTKLRGNVETEIFHETFPGHHLQMGLANENKSLYPISNFFPFMGYVEGWAGYAQIIAEEIGLYTSSYSRLLVSGRSSRIMYVEACINAKHWTRKMAIDYLLTTGCAASEKYANKIVDRILVWPGQYSTYDVGLIEMLELREQAMLTLGHKFNIKEFHSIILEDGAIPLEMLREKIDWWIKKKQAEEQ